jgi:hypothetical protein
MLPLCADQGIGVIPWSPLARGRLTRARDTATARAETDEGGKILYRDSLLPMPANRQEERTRRRMTRMPPLLPQVRAQTRPRQRPAPPGSGRLSSPKRSWKKQTARPKRTARLKKGHVRSPAFQDGSARLRANCPLSGGSTT